MMAEPEQAESDDAKAEQSDLGVLVRGFPDSIDEDHLNLYFEAKLGCGAVKCLSILPDKQSATVEFEEPTAVIPKLCKGQHSISGRPISIEPVDLHSFSQEMENKKTFVAVRGFPAEIADEEILSSHFASIAGVDAECVKVVMKDEEALVFFEDPNAISILSSTEEPNMLLGAPLNVEVVVVQSPCLLVKNIPCADEEMLRAHFAGIAGVDDEAVKVEIKDSETEALVSFDDTNAVMKVLSTKEHSKFLGGSITVELVEPEETVWLQITNLPPKIPEKSVVKVLKFFFKSKTDPPNAEIECCKVVNGKAFMKFEDTSVVERLLKNPPQDPLMGNTYLELRAIPASQVPESPQEEVDSTTSTPMSSNANKPPKSPYLSLQTSFKHEQVPKQSPRSLWASPSPSASGRKTQVKEKFSPEKDADSLAVEDLECCVEEKSPLTKRNTQRKTPKVSPNKVSKRASQYIPNKLLVEGYPPYTEEYVLKLYLEGITSSKCDVKLHKETAIVTFEEDVDFVDIAYKLKSKPFPQNKQPLTANPLKLPDSITVSDFPSHTQEFILDMYFKRFGEVIHVNMQPEWNRAVVKFDSHETVEMVLDGQRHMLGTTEIKVEEYFPFISPASSVNTNETSSVKTWHEQKIPIDSKEKFNFLQVSLEELDAQLANSEAYASLKEQDSCQWVLIYPKPAAKDFTGWDSKVLEIFNDFLEDSFTQVEVNIPDNAARDAVYDLADEFQKKILIEVDSKTIKLSGRKELVTTVSKRIEETDRCMNLFFPARFIKYLQKFSLQELNASQTEYELDAVSGKVTVRGSEKKVEAFRELLRTKKDMVQEESVLLSSEEYQLLSSKKGLEKIESDLLGTAISNAMYGFEKVEGAYKIYFQSKNGTACINAVKHLKKYAETKSFPVPQLAACNSQKLNDCICDLCKDEFVQVFVDENNSTVTVTGEGFFVDDIASRIKAFMTEETSVEQSLEYLVGEWKVIKENFPLKLNAVTEAASKRNVQVRFTQHSSTASSPVVVTVKGEPKAVEDVVVQFKMLKGDVTKKEAKIKDFHITSEVQTDFRRKALELETDHHVAIHYDTKEKSPSAYHKRNPIIYRKRHCVATGPNESTVTIYSGDFTQHFNTTKSGKIVYLLPVDCPFDNLTCECLIKAGGESLKSDLENKLKEFLDLRVCQVIRSTQGNLGCSEFVSVSVPSWNGDSKDDLFYLQKSLHISFQNTNVPMLLTPLSSSFPKKYFAPALSDALFHCGEVDLDIALYVENVSSAKEFEHLLQFNNFKITRFCTHETVAESMKSPSGHLSSLSAAPTSSCTANSNVSVIHGDMLQEQADVYINSTNESMDLSQGVISQKIFKTCGKELQEECLKLAPLKHGAVAVTRPKNLKSKFVFHINLPDFKSKDCEKIFRKTAQELFQTAQKEGATSIVIPSLGAGSLQYPVAFSAKVLVEEVRSFCSQNPDSGIAFKFVIFKDSDFDVFENELPTLTAVEEDDEPKVILAHGSIADESTDMIVNTTSNDMILSRSDVSRAIANKAGPELQKLCSSLNTNLDNGNVVTTKSCGKLSCKTVAHAHIPLKSDLGPSPVPAFQSLVKKIVTQCLDTAEKDGLSSISFPAFGTGQSGFSISEAAEPMLDAFKSFVQTYPKSVRNIRIIILNQAQHDDFRRYLCKSLQKIPASRSTFKTVWFSLGSYLGASKPPTSFSFYHQQKALSSPLTQETVVTVYAASPQVAYKVIEEIREYMKKMVNNITIDIEAVKDDLTEEDFQHINAIGSKHGLKLEIVKVINKLTIEGPNQLVEAARAQIEEIIREITEAKKALVDYEWTYEEGDSIDTYPPEIALKIERADRSKEHKLKLKIDGIDVEMDLKQKVEVAKDSPARRMERKRRPQIVHPSTWMEQPKENGHPKQCHVVEVKSGTPEFDAATKEFKATIGKIKYTIESVQRIQNLTQYASHYRLKENLEQQKYKGRKKTLEMTVFHGTRGDTVQQIIGSGFNRIFAADANAACYGKGTYFAKNASYSAQAQYSAPDSSKNKHILVCNLLVGRYTKGDQTMKIAPALDKANPHSELYDTLVDDEKNPTIFVAMTDGQAYPNYLIIFKET